MQQQPAPFGQELQVVVSSIQHVTIFDLASLTGRQLPENMVLVQSPPSQTISMDGGMIIRRHYWIESLGGRGARSVMHICGS